MLEHPLLTGMADPSTESIVLPHGPTLVQWRRSARARRISLRIDPRAGGVVVTLPARAAQAAGRALVMDHAGWIGERLLRLPTPVAFEQGAEVPLDGQMLRIRHWPGGRGARVDEGSLLVAGAPEFMARRVTDFMRAEARRRLGEAAMKKAGAAGLRARRVVVKDTRTRWGSCTADGTLMFCWRLVMAPALVQDYVVAHEVAHLRHMDHSVRFWALVDELTPHRAAATRWLSAAGASLMRTG